MIGILDVDLLDKKTNFPNLALMKISGYQRSLGNETKLVLDWETALDCEEIYCSKVFTTSNEPNWINLLAIPIHKGGTGYNLYNAPPLSPLIEHSKPDYTLYENYAKAQKVGRSSGITGTAKAAYLEASIGFTTRGCFRRCQFCVNRNKTKVERWSPVSEFYDESRPYIFMLDDNVFGCSEWRKIFDDLEATGKRASYRQGLDLRLMTREKAEALERIKYYADVGFAFDNVNDKDVFQRCATIYREYCNKETQAFCLVGFYKQGLDEIQDMVTRINILKQYQIFPFIMKHENFQKDKYAPIFVEAARFYNQRSICKNHRFVEFLTTYASQKAQTLYKSDVDLQRVLETLV